MSLLLFLDRHPRLALAITQVLCEGAAFLRNLILARLIGAEEMGLAVMLALAIRFLEMAGDLGLDRLLVQVEEGCLDRMRRSVHLLQLLKGIALSAVAALVAFPLAATLNGALNPAIIALAAVSLVLRGFANCDFRERQRDGAFGPGLLVEGGSNLLAALAIAPLAWHTRDYTAVAWASVLQAMLFCCLSHAVATRHFALGVDRDSLKRCLRYGLPIALNAVLMFIALQGDRLIVALHFPVEELARFTIAAQLVLLPALIGARYLLARSLPVLARLVAEPAGLREAQKALWLRTLAVTSAGALFFGLAGNAVLGRLYGNEYRVEPELIWLLALAAGLRLLRAVPSSVLMAAERTHWLFVCNLPRLLSVPVALWAAAAGGGLGVVVAIGTVGEALGLSVALLAASISRSPLVPSRRRVLLETT